MAFFAFTEDTKTYRARVYVRIVRKGHTARIRNFVSACSTQSAEASAGNNNGSVAEHRGDGTGCRNESVLSTPSRPANTRMRQPCPRVQQAASTGGVSF